MLTALLGTCTGACGQQALQPADGGGGFAPKTGPGDVDHFFPDEVGNQWFWDYTATGATSERDIMTATVTGQGTMFGVRTIVMSQIYPLVSFRDMENRYGTSPGGITYLGNNDSGDRFTAAFVPYPQLLFPVVLGDVATVGVVGWPAGRDREGNALTLNMTRRVSNAAFEPVSVPAGYFANALRQVTTSTGEIVNAARSTSEPISDSDTRWFVPGVGLVKQVSTRTMAGGKIATVAEVRGYSIDGVRRGIGTPVTVFGGFPFEPGVVKTIQGVPIAGSDGSNFLTVYRKVTDINGEYSSDWVAQRINPDGIPLGDSFALGPATAVTSTYDTQAAAMAFDGTNYLVVYEIEEAPGPDANNASLVAVRVSMQGSVLGTGATVASAIAPAADSYSGMLAVAFDGARYLLAFVRRINDLYQIRGVFISPSTGQPDGNEFAISGEPGYAGTPALAFDGTNYLVVWSQGAWLSQAPGMYAARVTTAGNVLDAGGIAVCTTNTCGYPAVAYDGSNYLVVWLDRRLHYPYDNIYGNRISPAGELLDGDSDTGGVAITTWEGEYDGPPALAFFGGSYLAAWSSFSMPGQNNGIFAARISPAGVILSPGRGPDSSGMPLTGSGFLGGPALAANSGSALLSWTEVSTAYTIGAVAIYPFGP